MVCRPAQVIPSLIILLIITATVSGCIARPSDEHKSAHHVEQKATPFFSDDFDNASLLRAAARQIAFLKRLPGTKTITFGSETVGVDRLLYSIQAFADKLRQQPQPEELDRFIRQNYLVFQAKGRPGHEGHMLVTGYYEPLFDGSLKKEAPYFFPIYGVPSSLAVRSVANRTQIGRYDNKQFLPFWSRAEIDGKNLLRGYELAFLKDPFDAFLLQVQGSGRILLPDKSIRCVRFAGSNGLQYKSIGKLLVDEKKMKLEDVSIPAIRGYLERHPDQQQRILYHNPRYIFFSWADDLGPRGSSGEVLTPGRSIALDTETLPGGTIAYLTSRRPVIDNAGKITGWTSINRFVFPQDSGAAIKGPGRVDLFWGSGNYAEIAANHMKEDGKLYFLVMKDLPDQTERQLARRVGK